MRTRRKRIDWSRTVGEQGAGTFVLLLHGLDARREDILDVAEAIESELGDCHVLVPELPLRWWHCGDLQELATEILDHLAGLDLSGYERLFVVGHSAGGVLAQAVYLLSRIEARTNAARVDLTEARLVLVAPVSQGWELSHHLPLGKKMAWMMGLALMPGVKLASRLWSLATLQPYRGPWILQIRRTSPFLVWMRLAWIDLHVDPHEEVPEVIELLGSVDELVSWRDMVDAATGQEFVYFEVPFSNHVSVIDFDDQKRGSERKRIFLQAFGDFETARACEEAILPWDTDPVPPDENVRRVVFVIHGIRDEGHWTQKIASRSRRLYAKQQRAKPREEGGVADKRREIAVVTSSYGYFSMLQFLLYPQRWNKVRWLVEQYVEARRRYPKAKLSYVGHSNGTYLVAHALERYPDVKFERLAFAGSVVSSRFDWPKRVPGQVRHVLNYVATGDWVVGIFPRLADVVPPLRFVLGPSLGGAGIVPFVQGAVPDAPKGKRQVRFGVQNRGFRKGAHAAAIEEDNWDHLASFAVSEGQNFNFPLAKLSPKNTSYRGRRALFFRPAVGWLTALAGWAVLLALLVAILPTMAWRYPARFWVPPLILLAGLFVGFSAADSMSRWFSLRRRSVANKALDLVLLGIALIGFVAILAGTALPRVLAGWSDGVCAAHGRVLEFLSSAPVVSSLAVWSDLACDPLLSALRTLSVVVYFVAVYLILTRV
jgi:pimeloyl-ACP methyl ester carboxylesterase